MNPSALALAKTHMIERQLKPCGITNSHVLQAMSDLERERFVPEGWLDLAYADQPLPVAQGQQMLAPHAAARLVQAAELEPTDTVLEVGTGTGYVTALLASLAFQIYSVEQHPELSQAAQQVLPRNEYPHLHFLIGNGLLGWANHAPYDAIVLTGSVPAVPEALLHQLAPGGRLVACVGQADAPQSLQVLRCLRPGHYKEQAVCHLSIAPLVCPDPPSSFVF